ncbi:Sugar (and other) transporter [Ceratobasidium sp. AG-Ba]|nr:Sugar (and other) transporter [Ceratobasidium sp. AG-Ba]
MASPTCAPARIHPSPFVPFALRRSESPRWLAAHERVPEAKAVLERLGFPIPEGDEGEIDKVMTTITDTVKFDEQFGSGRWIDVWRLFKHEDAIRSRRRLFIACAIQGFQQLGGVNEVTPTLITEIGYKTYIIFAALNASFIPVIYLTFPETKGLSLEEIDELFSSSRERLDETDSRTGIL